MQNTWSQLSYIKTWDCERYKFLLAASLYFKVSYNSTDPIILFW